MNESEYYNKLEELKGNLFNFEIGIRKGKRPPMFDLYEKLKEYGASDTQPIMLMYEGNTVTFRVGQLKHYEYGDWLRVRDDQGRMIAKRKCSRCGHIISNARKVVPTFCTECGSKNA